MGLLLVCQFYLELQILLIVDDDEPLFDACQELDLELVISPVNLESEEEEGHDLYEEEYQPVQVHSVVDASLDDVFVVVVDHLRDPILILDFSVDVGMIIEESLR